MLFQLFEKLKIKFRLKILKIFILTLFTSFLEILGIGLVPVLLLLLLKENELSNQRVFCPNIKESW